MRVARQELPGWQENIQSRQGRLSSVLLLDQPVLLQKHFPFLRKAPFCMMLRLIADVVDSCWNLRDADGECPVSNLPFKPRALLLMHPSAVPIGTRCF